MPQRADTLDLETLTLVDDAGIKLSFEVDPFRRGCLLKGLDDIGLTLRFAEQITAYEKVRQPKAVMYEPVDAVAPTPQK